MLPMEWNKAGSSVLSILVCILMDCWMALSSSTIGCYISGTFSGVLAYADDIVLMAPLAHAMRAMLSICETYSKDILVMFNASKSKCIVCTPQRKSWSSELDKHDLFTLDGSAIENVSSWPHLGRVICGNCDDNYDRSHKLAGQINNVLCTFSCLDSTVHTRKYCSCWMIFCHYMTWFVKKSLSFASKCLTSESNLVRYVACCGVFHGRISYFRPEGSALLHTRVVNG